MSSQVDRLSNPFAARYTRPQLVEYRFRDGSSARNLVDELAKSEWNAQIVGPHGSGKTTLLEQLIPELERRGRRVVRVDLHDGQRRLPKDVTQSLSAGEIEQIVIDGYEQLGRWPRWMLGRACRRQGCGLLVTAHTDVGLPTLYRTATDSALARELAERLAGPQSLVMPSDVAAAFAKQGGNLREVWFELYDLYELRRPGEMGDSGPSLVPRRP